MLITFMTSFARVRSKKLMDIEYISPFLIIFLTGLIGLFLNIISLIISTFIKCNVNSVNIMDELCKLDKDGERYYDNLFVFFSKLKDLKGKWFAFYIEIFAIIPAYIILNFLDFFCEIFIIYRLNPIYLLIRDSLFYIKPKILSLFKKDISLVKFIILETNELIAIIFYLVYLEVIELRFCGFDANIRRNLVSRAKIENLNNVIINDNITEEDDDDNNNNNLSRIETN
jgi:hypothetical protein